MELMPYTEAQRDHVEVQLASQANKREIDFRQSDGITVIAYWLMKENVCLIYVQDDRTNSAAEFSVPSEEVGHWFIHPFAHPDAQMPRYLPAQNGEANA